jgi:hypothetical protein
MSLPSSTHIRLTREEHARLGDAAARWYRGNRTDLMRDAIERHLEALYAGTVAPTPVKTRAYVAIVADASSVTDDTVDSIEAVW